MSALKKDRFDKDRFDISHPGGDEQTDRHHHTDCRDHRSGVIADHLVHGAVHEGGPQHQRGDVGGKFRPWIVWPSHSVQRRGLFLSGGPSGLT